jgi:hypothetical protein
MIANVIAEMRYAAQSHSPSRKTMSLGNDLGDGAEIGINQTTKNVAKAAKNMIDSSIKPIETAIKDVQAKDFSSIFDTSSFGANVSMTNRTVATIEGGALDTIANKLLQSNDRAIILQVDGKTFAETSINTINQLTRQSGTLALDIR